MRNRFDQFAKQALCALLEPAGPVETDKEVSAEVQRVDVWFVPDSARSQVLGQLGLLGRMAAQPCAIEAFHTTPGPEELAASLRKHATLCHHLALNHPEISLPTAWVVSSGRPTAGLEGYGCRRARAWPRGIYVAPPLLRMGIVVISELPRRPDTLLLRLMGAGPTLRGAISELQALPPDALARRLVLPIVVRLRLAIVADPATQTEQTEKDKEFLMSTQDVLEVWEQRVRADEHERALAEGLKLAWHTLLLLYESRFGPIPPSIRASIEATKDPDTLLRWSDLIARGSREQVDQALGGA